MHALSVLLLSLSGCYRDPETARWGRGEAVGQLIVQRVDRTPAGGTVNLRDLAPFRWERLHLFASVDAGQMVRDSLGLDWSLADRRRSRAEATLLVFTGGGEVLAATMLPVTLVGVAPPLLGRSYTSDDAGFRVEVEPDGRRVLVR